MRFCRRLCWWVCVLVYVRAQGLLDGELRLTGGVTNQQGRLEVFHHGNWGTVCDDMFGDEEAGVACWQLGFSRHGNNFSTIGIESSNLPILLDDLQCQGSEDRLAQCLHRGWGIHDCKDEEHVALVCRADPCRRGLCQNGATCIALNDVNITCQCSPVTYGQWCENYVDFCRTQNGGCSHQCINGQGSYQCACPLDSGLQIAADGHTCYAPTVEVRCGVTMEVAFPRRYWPGLHEQYITLIDRSCVATGNATHVTISVPLYACGTWSHKLDNGFAFENHVMTRDAPLMGLVSRVLDVNMTVRCHYSDDVMLNNWYIVNSDKIHFSDVAHGHYQLSLVLFHNGQRYVAGRPQEQVEPGESMSLRLSLSTNDSSLQVFARDCKATPSAQTDANQYLFLDDGCSKDPTFQSNRTSDTQESLELQAFQFQSQNASSVLLMHCDVIICNVTDPANRCTRGCLTGSNDAVVGDDDRKEDIGLTTLD